MFVTLTELVSNHTDCLAAQWLLLERAAIDVWRKPIYERDPYASPVCGAVKEQAAWTCNPSKTRLN